MKRTPLHRRTRLRQRATDCPRCARLGFTLCRCGTTLRPVNPGRKTHRYERNFGAWADTIRAMPCWWCGHPAPSDPAHTRSRSAGGDRRYLLPMCGDNPAMGRVGCHGRYDRYELGVDHDEARRQALALYARHEEAG